MNRKPFWTGYHPESILRRLRNVHPITAELLDEAGMRIVVCEECGTARLLGKDPCSHQDWPKEYERLAAHREMLRRAHRCRRKGAEATK